MFALVFLTTLVIHLLVEQEQVLLTMLAHAVMIGLVYVVIVIEDHAGQTSLCMCIDRTS